jgi:hypothetical protein
MSAEPAEFTSSYPASAKHPAKTSPSAKFVEQPKLLTKTRMLLHHDSLNALMTNKNVRVPGNWDLHKHDIRCDKAYKGLN